MTENTNSINSAIIGFWRMGATPIQITHVVELNLFYGEETILLYQKKLKLLKTHKP